MTSAEHTENAEKIMDSGPSVFSAVDSGRLTAGSLHRSRAVKSDRDLSTHYYGGHLALAAV